MRLVSRVSLFFFSILWVMVAEASHIRAVEITARRISAGQLTYEFTVTGYRDVGGVNFGAGLFRFGDGTSTSEINWSIVENVGNDTEKWSFTLIHTYGAAGAYRVSYREMFRNAGILNMANSGGTYYYAESLIVIDPLVGINNTPVLTIPPIDRAASGVIFIHNPGAFDIDGDSLSYVMATPLQDRDVPVTAYQDLINPSFYPDGFNNGNQDGTGPPTLTLDPVSGDLVWDAAGRAGEYNVAFVVEEWRKINGIYFRLGYVRRDMQIIVEDTDNEQPEVTVPEELCVAAGTFIDDTVYEPDIIGTDPDGHPVTLSAFGGPFEISQPAYYEPDPPVAQGPPGVLEFFWDTDCQHIRERPYEVRIKVEDNPGTVNGVTPPKLVDFETWNITVVGPAPTGLITTSLPGRRMQVEWDEYACANSGATMQIWRRIGSFDFTPENCEIGIPEEAGYELIATLPITQNLYVDTNSGLGLNPGSNYCYRLVAEFPAPTGGTSYASDEACTELEAVAPLITKADIISTSTTTGEVRVEWIDPPDIDGGLYPGPYTYDVLRATGQTQSPTDFVPVATNLTNRFFDDAGLNTEVNAYSYKIKMYDNTATPVDTSAAASTVRLTLQPQVNAIRVNWNALVPWSNQDADYPIHEVYRDQVNPGDPGQLVKIADVDVTQSGFTFLDDGSHNGIALDENVVYCYYVRAQGSYDSSDPLILAEEPLINNSQVQCAQPNDEVPPCTPINFMFDEAINCETLLAGAGSCDFDAYQHKLDWELDMAPGCGDDVVSFNLYFSETGAEGSYALLINTTSNTYTNLNLNSFKGCYRISSVDRSGNESPLSDPICQDNCIIDDDGNFTGYILPNAFTPNGDGVNDTFRAFGNSPGDADKCPRFVLSVDFVVVDRTGKELFRYSAQRDPEEGVSDDLFINWDGRTTGGKELPAGTYFYTAVVRFDTLDPKLAVKKLNGWIQLLR